MHNSRCYFFPSPSFTFFGKRHLCLHLDLVEDKQAIFAIPNVQFCSFFDYSFSSILTFTILSSFSGLSSFSLLYFSLCLAMRLFAIPTGTHNHFTTSKAQSPKQRFSIQGQCLFLLFLPPPLFFLSFPNFLSHNPERAVVGRCYFQDRTKKNTERVLFSLSLSLSLSLSIFGAFFLSTHPGDTPEIFLTLWAFFYCCFLILFPLSFAFLSLSSLPLFSDCCYLYKGVTIVWTMSSQLHCN